ncbi:MAG: hypothetical protein H6715_01530 [Myxococcales bacterium]|nr:hypothetical protein [Myxococcales bacterium]MCB9708977.1 hypothetical protein [Myxococcales bacterium]
MSGRFEPWLRQLMYSEARITLLWVVIAMASGALLYGMLASWLGASRRRWKARRRSRVAIEGEQAAIALLEAYGYSIVATQCSKTWHIEVDGAQRAIALRADAIVERHGRQFVAEIKTGEMATQLETAATRRQLLEYLVAYQADGALLVNVPRKTVHEVVFFEPRIRQRRHPFVLLAWIVLTAVLLWLLLR